MSEKPRPAPTELKIEQQETIAAIATAKGSAGVGIVRLSGRTAVEIAVAIFRPLSGSLAAAKNHHARFGYVVDGDSRLDEAVAIVMRSPHSYTGEDVVELQCHGGMVLLREILSLCYRHGARPATAGEYTKRAYLNGRLDLVKAEAVMDIIDAKTTAALKMAAGHLTGRASAAITRWRDAVADIVIHLEAVIDFPEEGLEELELSAAADRLRPVERELAKLIATADTGRILKDGLITAIIGRPNAGKSSLLNALLGEERAIVTDVAGTTRDSIEEYADVGGVPLRLIDTAGIRETADRVEKIGVDRAKAALAKAQLSLVLFDGSAALTAEDERIAALTAGKNILPVITKSDLPPQTTPADVAALLKTDAQPVILSAATGAGLEQLAERIVSLAWTAESREAEFLATQREELAARRARDAISGALAAIDGGLGADCATIDLAEALAALNGLLGRTTGTDIIDEIFSRFCVGK